jgi:hypothetical protein
LVRTSWTNNSTDRFTVDQALGLEEYHSNRSQLGCTFIYITHPNLRRGHHHHNVMGHFTEPAKLFS